MLIRSNLGYHASGDESSVYGGLISEFNESQVSSTPHTTTAGGWVAASDTSLAFAISHTYYGSAGGLCTLIFVVGSLTGIVVKFLSST